MTRKIGAETMEKSTSEVHRFYVIKFLKLPNLDIERYVCVPDSWVMGGGGVVLLHGSPEQRVKVAYPSGESREATSERVKREEEPWYEWNLYRAVVTYMTDSYDSARAWITSGGLNLLPALENVDTVTAKELDRTSSSGPNGYGCSNRTSISSSDENKENVIQDGIPNNKKDEVIDKNKYSQKMRKKTRRPSDTNGAFKYYVVRFKDLPDPTMRIHNYICVLKSWITCGLPDIEADNVPNINFEVKVAYPVDPREIPLDFRQLPDDPPEEWKSYRAVVKYITGAYYAAQYWIEKKMGISQAPVNKDAADMGGNPPPAAPDNSSSSSGGSSPDLPPRDLNTFEAALARCMSQPGLTVKKICKRPSATSACVDNMKRPKRVEESTAVYNESRMSNLKSRKPTQSTQNGTLAGQSKLTEAYDSVIQSIMSALRTNSHQVPAQTQAYTNQRDFYQSVDNNRFAEQNIYSTHERAGHPHMLPNGSYHIPAYQGYTYQNPQTKPVNNNCDTNYIAYRPNGRNLNLAYHYGRIPESATGNPHLFVPREHPRHRPDISSIYKRDMQIPITTHVTDDFFLSSLRWKSFQDVY